ncbi:MAG: ABC transporter ATP-binding protein [Epulopiscium sp.]|nr:ABC transporter ATP-binding protein [Candidatus Epulonipiscium sp.]
MLTINNINVNYGAIRAIKDVSFQVKQGEIVTLIGANGAGKTTILHTISALLRSQVGEIIFKDQNISSIEPHQLLKMGMAHVPEGRRVFSQMTVLENLELGAYTRKNKEEIGKGIEDVFEKFPRLKERKKQLAGTLSGGEQQMLAMGRALMSKPQLLLLDEPSMGLAPILVKEIFNIIEEINKAGTTVLLVEQNAHMALSIANRAYVLETGRVVLEGEAKSLLGNEQVRKAYLG